MRLPPFLLGCAVAAQSALALGPSPFSAQESADTVAPRPTATADALLARTRAILLEAQEAEKRAELPTARAKSVEAIDALLAGGPEAETAEALDLLAALGTVAVRAGALDAGTRACERVLTVRTLTLPEDALELQTARLDMASVLLDRRAAKEARPYIERALAVLERIVPEEHPVRLRGANQLGIILRFEQDYAGARAVHQRVLEIRTRTLPEGHEDILKSQENLAIGLAMLDEYAEARVLFEKVHDTYVRTLPDEHPKLLSARQNMAAILSRLGESEASRRFTEKVYEVRARTLPEDHPALQDARRSLAEDRKRAGDLEGARVLQEQVVTSFSRTLPEDHEDLLTAQTTLANTLGGLGDYRGQEQILEQVLAVRSRSLPADDPRLLWTRLELGTSRLHQGNPAGARRLQEAAVRDLARVLPEHHIDLAKARMNFAATLSVLGEFAAARALEERALGALAKSLPEDHPHVNQARVHLAATLNALGDRAGARALSERALAGYARKPPEKLMLEGARINYSDLLDSREALAVLEQVLEELAPILPADHDTILLAKGRCAKRRYQEGELREARALVEELIALRSRRLPEGSRILMQLRGDLALTLRRLGEFQAARQMQEMSLEIALRSLLPGDRELPRLRLHLAMTLAGEAAIAEAAGVRDETRRARCAELLRAACDAEIRLLRELQLTSAGREVEEYTANLPVVVSDVLSFARGYGVFPPEPNLVESAFILSETTRGAAVQAAVLARRASGMPQYAEARAAWKQAGTELAALAQSGGSGAAFEAARVRREEAERALVALARGIPGSGAAGHELHPSALRAQLAARTALVVFRTYSDWSVSARAPVRPLDPSALAYTSKERLSVFVLRGSDSERAQAAGPSFVDLGPSKDVRLAAEAWRSAVLAGRGPGRGLASEATAGALTAGETVEALGDRLRRLVFDPLRAELGDVERIVFVLDDVLHLVPLDALPLAEADGNGLFGDRWRIETRVTSSELLARDAPAAGGTLVSIGGASFNLQPLALSAEESEKAAKEEPTQVAALLRGTTSERGFEPLTHTADEARGVAALFEEAFEDEQPLVLAKRKASRDALLEAAPGARFLHVATHGWYAPESIRSSADDEPGEQNDASSLYLSSGEKVRRMSPMLLSGLALAGANLPEDGAGRAPGLVTAEEIAALDLSACELAVLSACDTNVGERRLGQGVASFQRALHMAGARSVITSLWKVPDEATKELMLDFYRRLWVEKAPKREALWAAKKRLREARDESGQLKYTLRDWAGWVLTGQPD